MLRQAHAGALFVLEGKDDMLFWRNRHRHRPDCRLVRGDGRGNVVQGMLRLDARGTNGVLGLVDSDYSTFRGDHLRSDNLVATDAHDLECLLCRSKALDAVLDEHGDPVKIRRFETRGGFEVRQALLDRAVVFGRVRLLAALWEDGQLQEKIRVPEFLNERTWSIDEDRLLDAAASQSHQPRKVWEERLDQLLETDSWYVAVGHDMVEILRIGLRNVLGDMPASIGVKGLASALRMAMSRQCLEATGLWKEIRAWEDVNRPFAVLPD